MSKPLPAIDYLNQPAKHPVPPVCVAFGDESFFKREVIRTLREQVLDGDDGDFSLVTLSGRDAEPRDVFDQLATVSMFGADRRMVVIDQADPFVSRFRSTLEDYVAQPKRTGVLVLEVTAWASNTRLYKAVAAEGLQIQCKTPSPAQLLKYLTARARKVHRAKLDPAAADLLVDLVEPEVGLLDQELARLALLAGPDGEITSQLVSENVGSWRTQTTWELIDAAAAGNARDALDQLDRLILAGEHPIAILGQMASTLRRFAKATRLVDQQEQTGRRAGLRAVLEQAGFKRFVIDKAERQLRQIGRARGQQLYRWLLEADVAMKGESSSPGRARLVLERLIVRLSTLADPRRNATR